MLQSVKSHRDRSRSICNNKTITQTTTTNTTSTNQRRNVPEKMAVRFTLLLSRQGKVRLSRWYQASSQKEKGKITNELTTIILARRAKMCNILEYKDMKIVYRRYASLFFVMGIDSSDNGLATLEIIHRYVEQMDKLYGNVCELDIIFGFSKAYNILDELLLDGYMMESSKKEVVRKVSQQDELENMDEFENILA
ncbi:putative AP-1 complex subunit [Clavispora lusitaniae]|uniref:AP-1 complex subunit n=1 Tax=Clavispora lusitaniae TaxID=36911 RepID=A0ACD0WNY4_CLALS|nr:putative AP-1 complex subunit [Clavispora lusitaniae]QFZ34724.1 putative AP-1 complex subunit [Clavispora lusitaniae]QFZ40409.1 putative AP-1 complex subunit [Clavispora lusitaniae]QFZ46089.1 putative AP-1 complex subunit [Clavispora lusitaniae]QFZ51751.1 putative AP-1 complex subunit [Clavispora lusitaniae]